MWRRSLKRLPNCEQPIINQAFPSSSSSCPSVPFPFSPVFLRARATTTRWETSTPTAADPTASSTGFGTQPHARPRLAKARSSHKRQPGVSLLSLSPDRPPTDLTPTHPPPRPWSRLVLSWLSPLIMVGFTRPLEKDGASLSRARPFAASHLIGDWGGAQICGSSTTPAAPRLSRAAWRATSTRAVRRRSGLRICDLRLVLVLVLVATSTLPTLLPTARWMVVTRRAWTRWRRARRRLISRTRQERRQEGRTRGPSTTRPSRSPSRVPSSSISGSLGSCMRPEVRPLATQRTTKPDHEMDVQRRSRPRPHF